MSNYPGCIRLNLNGINYKADIWVNGNKAGDKETISGTFRKHTIDITDLLKEGSNIIALEVTGPKPDDYAIGYVDWNPAPPDNNMGIWREVKLDISGEVSINNPFVQSEVDLSTLKDAALNIQEEIINHSNRKISGTLTGKIEDIIFHKDVSLKSGEKRIVEFNAQEYNALNIKGNARLWWPYELGEPNLYTLDLDFSSQGKIMDNETINFGIREVSDYINEKGVRGYKINGKNILIKGGGWTDDLLLANTLDNIEAQLKYVRHMNLNTIRFEEFWGKDELIYELCDKYGILIMAGLTCHWEWSYYIDKKCGFKYGCIKSEEDIKLVTEYFKDEIFTLRNHPSLFVWTLGGDKLPHPELEKRYIQMFNTYDPARQVLTSTKDLKSSISGHTGVKMRGPYSYVPPVYWYIDKNR